MEDERKLIDPTSYETVSLFLKDAKKIYDDYEVPDGEEKPPFERYPNDGVRWVFPYPKDIWDAWINEGVTDPDDLYIPPPKDDITGGYPINPIVPDGPIYDAKYLRLWDFINNPLFFMYPNSPGTRRIPFPAYTAIETLPRSGIFPSLCPKFLPDAIGVGGHYARWQKTISLKSSDVTSGFLDPLVVPRQRVAVTRAFDNDRSEDDLNRYEFRPSPEPEIVYPARPDYSRVVFYPNDTSFSPMPYRDFVIHAASAWRTNGWYALYRQKVVRSPSFPFPEDPKTFGALIAVRRKLFETYSSKPPTQITRGEIMHATLGAMTAETSAWLGVTDYNPTRVDYIFPKTNLSPRQEIARDKIYTMRSLVRQSLRSVLYDLVVDDQGNPVFEELPYRLYVVSVASPTLNPTAFRSFYTFPEPISVSVPPFLSGTLVRQLDFERNFYNIDWAPQGTNGGFVAFSYTKGSPHEALVTTRFPGQYVIDCRVSSLGEDVVVYRFLFTIEKLTVSHTRIDISNLAASSVAVTFEAVDELEAITILEHHTTDPNLIESLSFNSAAMLNVLNTGGTALKGGARKLLFDGTAPRGGASARVITGPSNRASSAEAENIKRLMNQHQNDFALQRLDLPYQIIDTLERQTIHSSSSTHVVSLITPLHPFVLMRRADAPFYPVLLVFTFTPVTVKVWYFGQTVTLDPHLPNVHGKLFEIDWYLEDGTALENREFTVASPHQLGVYYATVALVRNDLPSLNIYTILYSVEMFDAVPKSRFLYAEVAHIDATPWAKQSPFMRAMCDVLARDHRLRFFEHSKYFLAHKDYVAAVDGFLAMFEPKVAQPWTQQRSYDPSTLPSMSIGTSPVPLTIKGPSNTEPPRVTVITETLIPQYPSHPMLPFLLANGRIAFYPFEGNWVDLTTFDPVSPAAVFYDRDDIYLIVAWMKVMTRHYLEIAEIVVHVAEMPKALPLPPPPVHRPVSPPLQVVDYFSYMPDSPDDESDPEDIDHDWMSFYQQHQEEEDLSSSEEDEITGFDEDEDDDEIYALEGESVVSTPSHEQTRLIYAQRRYFRQRIDQIKLMHREFVAAGLERLGGLLEGYISEINQSLMRIDEQNEFIWTEVISVMRGDINRMARRGTIDRQYRALAAPKADIFEALYNVYVKLTENHLYRAAGPLEREPKRTLGKQQAPALDLVPGGLNSEDVKTIKAFLGPYDITPQRVFRLMDVVTARKSVATPFEACLVIYCTIKPYNFRNVTDIGYTVRAIVAHKTWLQSLDRTSHKDKILQLLGDAPDLDWLEARRLDYQYSAKTVWPFHVRSKALMTAMLVRIKERVDFSGQDDDTVCDLLSVTVPEVALVWPTAKSWAELRSLVAWDLTIVAYMRDALLALDEVFQS